MKGLYVAPVDEKSKEYIGVYKKVMSQIEAFIHMNVDMDFVCISGNNIKYNKKEYTAYLKHKQHFMFYMYLLNHFDKLFTMYDFVYIRFSFCNKLMFNFIKRLYNKNIKVIVEIPTYPYADEIDNSLKNIVLKKIDCRLWKSNSKYIYRLSLTNDMKELFGIKAVNIFNGINKKDLWYNKDFKKKNDRINLIGVANISPWHGYDRIIKGLKEYYDSNPNIKVYFYVVGEGIEKNKLIELVNNLNLNDYVIFKGSMFGQELQDLYKYMDIGVSSLALFRAGGGHDPIKSKEYVAKGLPVIIGYNDRALSNNLPFVIKVSQNNEYVDINQVINKYKKLNLTSKEISEYALKNLIWEEQIGKIINAIKN